MSGNISLCTLFDSNYLDRGIVLYESLERVCNGFTLYALAMDDTCEHVLRERQYSKLVIVSYKEFEDELLSEKRDNTPNMEYCWMCAGISVRFIMDRYGLDNCTYIDADICFYSDPSPVIRDFLKSDCDVAIIQHNFGPNMESRYLEKTFGRYCVEFNTFRNTDKSRKVLDWWIARTLERCSADTNGGSFGDQTYLEEFEERFGGVYEYKSIGAGVAPWNIDRFILRDGWTVKDKKSGVTDKLIFYHFHQLDVTREGRANLRIFIRPGRHDRETVMRIYGDYVRKICRTRQMLYEKYGLFKEKDDGSHRGVGIKSIIDLMMCEPNIVFAVRKAFRYLLFKRLDMVRFDV